MNSLMGHRSRLPVYFYQTPEWSTAELLQRLPLERGDLILDPACGEQSIAKVVKDFSNQIYIFTNDVNGDRPADFHFDMTRRESWQAIELCTGGFDWVIGHPPFWADSSDGKKIGKPIVHRFLEIGYQFAKKGVVFLLKKSFTEPVGYRRSWLQAYRQEQFLELRLEPISFNCTCRPDGVACDWYGWKHGHTGGLVPEYVWMLG
jgi:hypothetical protein